MKYDPHCYLDHLWGIPPVQEQKRESTHGPSPLPSWPGDCAREIVLRPWWERKGESSVLGHKTLPVGLLEITATTNTVLNYISELPKIWEFQVTSAHPAAPSCALRGAQQGTQPAFILSAHNASGSPYSSSLQKRLVLNVVLKCEHSTPQLGNKILAMKM